MKTTTRKSIELYNAMTPKQLAAMTWQCKGRDDKAEAERVRDSVELRDYRTRHCVYSDWLECMHTAALVAGVIFWRHQALIGAGTHTLSAAIEQLTEAEAGTEAYIAAHEETDDIIERLNGWKSEASAMLAGLEAFCDSHGFSFEAALKVANIPEGTPIEGYTEKQRGEWLATFEEGKPQYAPHQNITNLPKGQNP